MACVIVDLIGCQAAANAEQKDSHAPKRLNQNRSCCRRSSSVADGELALSSQSARQRRISTDLHNSDAVYTR